MSLLARAEMAESKLAAIKLLILASEAVRGALFYHHFDDGLHTSRDILTIIDAEVWDGYQFLKEEE